MEVSDGPAPGFPDIYRVVADNPGPMTLTGTNTYLVGADPCWVIDPGPDDDAHVAAVGRAIEQRGGAAGALLSHSHVDHTGMPPRSCSRLTSRNCTPKAASRLTWLSRGDSAPAEVAQAAWC